MANSEWGSLLATHYSLLADLHNSQRPARVSESSDGEVDVACRQRRRHLRADARRALRHHGEEKAGDENAALVERLRKVLRKSRVPEHHRNDRRHAGQDLEARRLDPGAKAFS